MTAPPWLPPLLPVNPWNEGKFDLLYGVFDQDFLKSALTYRGFNVWFYPDVEEDGKEAIFWHLTTRENEPNLRLPDFRRCERLAWVRPMILRCPCITGDILDWDHLEGSGAIKTYIWLHQHDFVVIMKKLPDGRRRLITCFHLDRPHERLKMQRKWERRL